MCKFEKGYYLRNSRQKERNKGNGATKQSTSTGGTSILCNRPREPHPLHPKSQVAPTLTKSHYFPLAVGSKGRGCTYQGTERNIISGDKEKV